jgi:hypothetical protein
MGKHWTNWDCELCFGPSDIGHINHDDNRIRWNKLLYHYIWDYRNYVTCIGAEPGHVLDVSEQFGYALTITLTGGTAAYNGSTAASSIGIPTGSGITIAYYNLAGINYIIF